eukprot:CAMPEP_0204587274 /NCGR_PEP_ID=MMETSP0661-20131031/47959_1 /ASSEMBLY_ACC=CAM_ASM_000606 /TAXON_ID=109239 /ORGANISM="Alexandrium margalefi, Strain AMGDE01CS-322" /LENGTH=262 /DNA_ID=CAMNT_0051596977 /DNA_START=8 /DNA_END=796 /DNA_ORIENTATION=+
MPKGKKVAAPPAGVKKVAASKKASNPLFEKRPRNFGIGGAIQPKRDLGRFVKWPKYVRLQRQKAVIVQRIKVPPSVNQFTKTLEKNQSDELFKLLAKYRPETKADKKKRLSEAAEKKVAAKDRDASTKPCVIKFGLNHVTTLVEAKKAKLVCIAHNVEPIELVVWLPALCRKMGIPYCIVRDKARLGSLVHQKTATVVCLTEVKAEDKPKLVTLCENIKANYNDKFDETRRKWGGGVLGNKSQAKVAKFEKLKAKEAAAKLG